VAKKPKKKKLSADEVASNKLKRDHTNLIRSVFSSTGFKRYAQLSDRQFKLSPTVDSDFDDIFVFENLVVCVEYTTNKDIGDHLRKKNIVYENIRHDPKNLLTVLGALDQVFKADIAKDYNPEEIVIRCLYCSRYEFENKHKENASSAYFLDYAELKYFKSLTDSIRISARSELIDFLKIPLSDLGSNGKVVEYASSHPFAATVLPEANSNFDPGFKVVSFYVDPESLIGKAYVLRRQGWRDSDDLYQRMISKKKIEAIRKHLKSKKRVFVNNIIATLHDDTKIIDKEGNTVDPAKITKTTSVILQIPNRLNTIGLIDGQHRTFSYYESNPDDDEIAKLRKKLNLLVTGIIYPKGMNKRDRESFEARLFLEINSTQSNARSDLKQAINRIVDPYADESIAATVVERLGKSGGPLGGHIVRHWFDKDKLRTTSVVSYGMKPLVKTLGGDSLHAIWENDQKDSFQKDRNSDALEDYIRFCVGHINSYLIGVKKNLPGNLWTPDRKVQGRLITTTVVNSLLICLRLLIDKGETGDSQYYEGKFSKLNPQDFKGFHSSQYGKLAEKLYDAHFK